MIFQKLALDVYHLRYDGPGSGGFLIRYQISGLGFRYLRCLSQLTPSLYLNLSLFHLN